MHGDEWWTEPRGGGRVNTAVGFNCPMFIHREVEWRRGGWYRPLTFVQGTCFHVCIITLWLTAPVDYRAIVRSFVYSLVRSIQKTTGKNNESFYKLVQLLFHVESGKYTKYKPTIQSAVMMII